MFRCQIGKLYPRGKLYMRREINSAQTEYIIIYNHSHSRFSIKVGTYSTNHVTEKRC